MRILMTADAVGGVWTYALELAEALGRFGVTIDLATMGPPPSEAQAIAAASIGNVRLHVSEYALEWMHDPWADVAAAGEWLMDLEYECKPDVVHLNGYVHGNLAWQAPVIVVGHSCVCSWWNAVHGENPPYLWEAYRREVAAGLHAADVVVTPTRQMLRMLQRHYGRLERSRVIYNSRNPAHFRPTVAEPLVFTAGRIWDEAKNVAAVDAIAADLAWPVCLAGESRGPAGRGSARFRAVHPLGTLSEAQMSHWLGRASIFALPARYEPFGLTPLEAALAGCALVLGDIPSLREVWADAAVFVPPDDHAALRDGINRLINDSVHRVTMTRRARQRATHYIPAAMAEGYMAIYNSLTARQPDGRLLSNVPHSTPDVHRE